MSSIPEISSKCDLFAAFAGTSAKYHGMRERDQKKKNGDKQKKSQSQYHATLCGRGNRLQPPGSVAFYLAEGSFNLSNDTSTGSVAKNINSSK